MTETEAFEAFHQTRFPVSGAAGAGATYIQAGEQLKGLLQLYYLAACAWQRERDAQMAETGPVAITPGLTVAAIKREIATAIRGGTPCIRGGTP